MERSSLDGAQPGRHVLSSRANGRPSSLTINTPSQRKSLFTVPLPKENIANDASRPASSTASVLAKPPSPSHNLTRIPRPSTQRPSQTRRPFTLTDAYKMAEEEEAAQGSPSPAPRSWRNRRDSTGSRTSSIKAQTSLESPHRRALSARVPGSAFDKTARTSNLAAIQSQQEDASDNEFEERLRQHALDESGPGGVAVHANGRFSRSNSLSKTTEPGRNTGYRIAHGAPSSTSPARSPLARTKPKGGWLTRRLSGKQAESVHNTGPRASADMEQSTSGASRNYDFPATRQSPEYENFAWQADTDFIPSELQVSDSPPVRIGRSNSKIDEIRILEDEANLQIAPNPRARSRNTRLEEIRALESEIGSKPPVEPPDLRTTETGISLRNSESLGQLRSGSFGQAASTRIDEIWAHEIESSSRRAVATTRLDQIRERNAEYRSRSASTELRGPSNVYSAGDAPFSDKIEGQIGDGKQVALVDQSAVPEQVSAVDGLSAKGKQIADATNGGTIQPSRSSSRAGFDHLDGKSNLTTTTGPSLDPVKQALSENRDRRLEEKTTTREKKSDIIGGEKKPSVGFSGLKREPSIESVPDKRSSALFNSEIDPTDRIEGEMKLFAPLDNYSEKGSLRAPSPATTEDDAIDVTPRAPKPNPLIQATPRVTGAYVETPATVRVEKMEESHPVPAGEHGEQRHKPAEGGMNSTIESLRHDAELLKNASLRGRKQNASPRRPRQTLSVRGDSRASRSSSAGITRRSKSLSRSRKPLINSSNPPTVKEDLLAIQRANQIEDSTLEDLADLLDMQDDEPTILPLPTVKSETQPKKELDRDGELEAYDRMNKSLQSGLIGIMTAKKGIERLEDEVSHADIKNRKHTGGDGKGYLIYRGQTGGKDETLTYVQLPLPRLWHGSPLRPTRLGLVFFLVLSVLFWLLAETAVCSLYCKPQYCYPGQPCDWSPDDPLWGYSIPIKLDQWTTGGKGRQLATRLEPEVSDRLLDIWDSLTGVDLATVDTSRYTWAQKRQHRRRLLKRGFTRTFVERVGSRARHEEWEAHASKYTDNMDDDDLRSVADDEILS